MKIKSAQVYTDVYTGEKELAVAFLSDGGNIETFSVKNGTVDKELAHLQAVKTGDMTVDELYDRFSAKRLYLSATDKIKKFFDEADDIRVNEVTGTIYYNGNVIDPTLSHQIIRIAKTDSEKQLKSLALFMKNLYMNQDSYVRSQFFSWLVATQRNDNGFTITEDGQLLGYKGCMVAYDKDGGRYSVSQYTGNGFVNGVLYTNAHLPNRVGDVVHMPREWVTADPAEGCSEGLHVGTYSYASDFACGSLLLVKVHPKDIVSVPTHCNSEKIRCSRYVVMEETTQEYTDPVYFDPEGFEMNFQEDEDYDCDDCQ